MLTITHKHYKMSFNAYTLVQVGALKDEARAKGTATTVETEKQGYRDLYAIFADAAHTLRRAIDNLADTEAERTLESVSGDNWTLTLL